MQLFDGPSRTSAPCQDQMEVATDLQTASFSAFNHPQPTKGKHGFARASIRQPSLFDFVLPATSPADESREAELAPVAGRDAIAVAGAAEVSVRQPEEPERPDLHPQHDIRIESFRDTKLPEGRIDAAIGNVPFSDLKLDYQGQKLSLHDYFFAKSIDALKPGGILAMVTSHFTLDKKNGAVREFLAERADFLGAIRLPSDAFKREGTSVVTDIVFLRKRAAGEP